MIWWTKQQASQAIVQATKQPGPIRLTATSEGLQPAIVTVQAGQASS